MLTKIHHVGLVVRSADAALTFYRDALGLPVTKDEVLEDQGVRGVLLQTGESEIELLQPTRDDSGVARYLASKGESMHHLCFESDDVGAELDVAKAKGLQLVDQAPRQGLAGMIGFLHPKATRGVLVEYATPPAGEGGHHGDQGGRANGVNVTSLHRVFVLVSDFAGAKQTWEGNFGLELPRSNDVPMLDVHAGLMAVGNAFIELMTPLSDQGPVAAYLKERGECLYMVSLEVTDIEAAVASLREKDVRVTDVMDGPGNARVALVSPRSTHGMLIQLRLAT